MIFLKVKYVSSQRIFMLAWKMMARAPDPLMAFQWKPLKTIFFYKLYGQLTEAKDIILK